MNNRILTGSFNYYPYNLLVPRRTHKADASRLQERSKTNRQEEYHMQFGEDIL